LTVGAPTPAAETAFDWMLRHYRADGASLAGEAVLHDPDALGGAVETATAFGAFGIAGAWSKRLIAEQRPDGSLRSLSPRSDVLMTTAAALRGLLALETECTEARRAAAAACEYIRSQIADDGRIRSATRDANGRATNGWPAAAPWAILAPLLDGAARLHRPDWEAAGRRALAHAQGPNAAPCRWRSTRAAARQIEALIDLGRHETAVVAMRQLAGRQRRDGAIAAQRCAGWGCTAGLAHLAVCWYRLAAHDPEAQRRADRVMAYLMRRQRRNGALRGGFGRGRPSEFARNSAAAVKHFLDASIWQVQAAFAAPRSAAADLPDRIDADDGRVQAVRAWAAGLPADARIADVGCGTGRFLRHVCRWFPQAALTGIDVSTTALAGLPRGVTPLEAGLLHVPLPDGTFDAALAVESLEHALLAKRAVAELCRIVRPGGRVLIVDKHRARQPLSHCHPWERWFTPHELAAWLGAYCRDVTVESVSHCEGRGGTRLFLAAAGTRKQQPTAEGDSGRWT